MNKMKTLKRYLSQFSSIGWYMSAGLDFREMMYLSKEYSKHLGWNEGIFPGCFLLTDIIGEYYFDKKLGEILKGETVLFKDDKTLVIAKNGEELQSLEFPGYREGIVIADSYMGRVITADIEIESSVLGHLSTKLVYVITENTAFMFDFLLKEHIRIDYLIHVRYGMARSSGMFVKPYLKELGTRYFISDWNDPSEEDYAVFETYKDKFEGKQDVKLLDTGLFVPSYRWSWSGDVHWYRVL